VAQHPATQGISRPASGRKLAGIQALRALAAFGVVACHLVGFEAKYLAGPAIAPRTFLYGMAGVDLYFVISGFIITLICTGQFGRPGEPSRFLWRRFIRVYPIFLIWCLAVYAVFLLRPGMVNSSHGRPDILASFLLLPQQNLPLLLVSWTLVFEAFFYLMFAAALRWLRQVDLARWLLAWSVLVVAGNLLLQPTRMQPWLNLVFSPLQLEFVFGCFIALYVDRITKAMAWSSLVLGVVVCAAGMVVLDQDAAAYPLGWGRSLVFGSAAALLVIGVVGLEQFGRQCFPRSLAALGDSSYSLYLSHIPVIAVVGLFWRHAVAAPSPAEHAGALLSAFGVAILAGIVSYQLLEVPMLRVLRRVSLPSFSELRPRLRRARAHEAVLGRD